VSEDAAAPVGRAAAPAPIIIASVARERGITGVHTHVRQLRSYLERVGEPAELITAHSWARGSRLRSLVLLPLFGVRVILEKVFGPGHVWWYRTSHQLFLREALRRRLAQEGACTVYAQCPVSAQAALDARIGPHQRVVLAVHFVTSQADEWVNKRQISRDGRLFRSIRRAEDRVVSQLDGLVFVSSCAYQALRKRVPDVDRVPTKVLSNFVIAPSVDPAPAAGDLVTVGNLDAMKNHSYLLRILAAAKRLGHTYSVDVFGQGGERRSLVALADDLGLGDQVRLRGFRTDVQQWLPRYRAYAHTSLWESSSLAIMEAMAAGLPVCSTTAGALAELFDDGVEGRFWPLDDPEAAARILVDLMEDPAGLARAGRAARERFLRDYDADVVAPRLLRFLRAPGGAAASG
jgi:glycosyltransferase involved in cell wall biosynthesis